MEHSGSKTSRAGFAEDYLGAFLRPYYSNVHNRLFLYLLLTAFFFLGVLLGLVIYRGPSVLVSHMSFTTVYALHTALAYSFCHWTVDTVASRTFKEWAAYDCRTVGRLWLIWSGGFLLGFVLHRTVVPCLMYLYATDIIVAYSMSQTRPSHLAFFLFGLPLWSAAVFSTSLIALGHQQPYRPQPAHKPLDCPAPEVEEPETSLTVNVDSSAMELPVGCISHVSMEDHYSRIFYHDGVRQNNVLIRSTMKELVGKLPKNRFLQIHRSHLVNPDRITGLTGNGRQTRVALDSGFELPVSRYRLSEVRQRLRPRMRASVFR